MTRFLVLFAPAAVLAATAFAAGLAPDAARDRANQTITGAEIGAHVETLASDAFEGRAPATEGEKKTLAYLIEHLRTSGVAPRPDGSYLHEVPLVKKTPRASTSLTVRGSKKKTVKLALGNDLIARAGGIADRIVIENSDLVFVGYGIVAEEHGWDDYAGVDVTGKTVVALMNDPVGLSDSLYFKGKALSHYGTSTAKTETAGRRGAKGIIYVHDEAVAGYPWQAIAGSVMQPRFERVPGPHTAPAPGFTATIHRDAAAAIVTLAGKEWNALVAAASQHGARAVPLGVTVSGDVAQALEYSTSYNVVGHVLGSERPDEYVVYTAHWDHVGIGAPVDGDSIYNGAVDNATGTAALLEIAQAFASLADAPKRTVVFIATTAEEQGLLGAYHYADNPVFPLERTVGVINMDALFPFDEWNGMTVVGLGSSELEDYLRMGAAAMGRGLQADPQPEHGAFFRSDHYPFAKKGVPAIFAVGGPLDEPMPSQAVLDRFTDYITNRYHRPSDAYGDDWNLGGLEGDARTYFLTGYAIANDDRVPNWYLDSEFRALRDRQVTSPAVVGGH